jgi:hypothetical protein
VTRRVRHDVVHEVRTQVEAELARARRTVAARQQ